MDLKEKLARAIVDAEAAEAALEPLKESIAMRSELADTTARKNAAVRAKAWEEVERRREALETGFTVEALMVQAFPDTFIVRRNGPAHREWTNQIRKANQSGKHIDTDPIHRKYAIATIVDWNGIQDFDTNSESTVKLGKYLADNSGLLSPICDLAAKLAGVFADEQKSSD